MSFVSYVCAATYLSYPSVKKIQAQQFLPHSSFSGVQIVWRVLDFIHLSHYFKNYLFLIGNKKVYIFMVYALF